MHVVLALLGTIVTVLYLLDRLGVAKLDGDVSAEQKRTVLDLFVSKFSMSEGEASDLFTSATHLLAAPQLVGSQLEGLADKNRTRFSAAQAESMLDMMVRVAEAGGTVSAGQRAFIDDMRGRFVQAEAHEGTWA